MSTPLLPLPNAAAILERWRNDPAVRAEFGDVAVFASYSEAVAAGRAKILAPTAVQPEPTPAGEAAMAAQGRPLEERARATWSETPQLQAEFGAFEAYLGYRRWCEARLARR